MNRLLNIISVLAVHLLLVPLSLPARDATFVEPVYQTKTLSEWLVELNARPSSEDIEAASKEGRDSSAAYEHKKLRDEAAIRQIGTNGLPVLLEILGVKAGSVTNVLSRLKAKDFQELLRYEKLDLEDIRKIAVEGFEILGTNAEPAIPQLSKLLHEPEISEQAGRALSHVGPRGFAVLTNALTDPRLRGTMVWVIGYDKNADSNVIARLLISCLKDENPFTRGNAADFLAGKNPDLAIPALISVLDSPEYYPRDRAAGALSSFGTKAKSAVPKLFSMYTNVIAGEDKELARTLGTGLLMALQKIDPETAAKAESFLIASSPVSEARNGHTMTVLFDGRTLFAGGYLHASNTNRILDRVDIQDPVTKQWSATGPLNIARHSHTATLLEDGRVLVVGGYDAKWKALASAELYDPKTGKWTMRAPLRVARFYHSAGLQPDGTVLVAGGHTGSERLETTEVYNPVTDTWTDGPAIPKLVPAVRSGHTATMLKDGKILVVGGDGNGLVELYDTATGTWTNVGSLLMPRVGHSATLLKDDSVLVLGGFQNRGEHLSSAEVFEPAIGKWKKVESLSVPAFAHTATLLNDGRVLVTGGGGVPDPLTRAELFDPANGKWTPAKPMHTKRGGHTATLLPNGKVLVAGGADSEEGFLASAEVYDPATDRWIATDELNVPRWRHTATLLRNGKVLIAGGQAELFDHVSAAELYDPDTGRWSGTGQMNLGRYDYVATLLGDGDVLVTGSETRDEGATAEVYSATTEKWKSIRPMAVERRGHTATWLPNGKVLILGGDDPANRIEIYNPRITPSAP